jgi:hypothetical protein
MRILFETIIAELIAGFLLLILGGLLSKKARWVLTATLGRLLDVDVEYVFRSKREADEDIRREINRTSFIYLLTGRGNELQRETFAGALRTTSTGAKPIFRILLPIARPKAGQDDWTGQREKEIASIDLAFGNGILREQIETTVKFLDKYVDAGVVEVKRFNYPHIGRVLITDRVVYFTPYRRDAHGRDSSVIKYRRGEMYDFFLRLFDQFWGQS